MPFNNSVNEYKPATSTWQLSYLLTDHLGSVVAVADKNGALVPNTQKRYLPFGGERTNLGTISQTDYGYTGQRDLNMGLMDYKARFYSPILGRFTQPDTITPGGPQGLNRYSYVGNNPIGFNDPSGHMRINDGPQRSRHGCHDPFYCANGQPYVRESNSHPSTKPLPSKDNDNNSSIKKPVSNLELPFGEWKSCSYLYVTETCAHGSSTMNLKLSNLNITTSPKSITLGFFDLSVNNAGDLDYSIDVHSSFHGHNELKSTLGISVASLNSIKVAGDMSVVVREENVSGKFTVGLSHEYHPENQFLMQTIGGAIAAAAIVFPGLTLDTISSGRPIFGN